MSYKLEYSVHLALIPFLYLTFPVSLFMTPRYLKLRLCVNRVVNFARALQNTSHTVGVTHTVRYRCCKRDVTVLTPLQQRYMDTMPVKVKEDTSNLLISPMPG